MFFSKNLTPLGGGRVTSARESDGAVDFLTVLDGAVALRRFKSKSARENIISYADECYFLGGVVVERKGSSLAYAENVGGANA